MAALHTQNVLATRRVYSCNNCTRACYCQKETVSFSMHEPNSCVLPVYATSLHSTLACHCRTHSVSALDWNTVLYGVSDIYVVYVHSETITDTALCSPQTSYADYLKDTLVHNANISYFRPLQACQLEARTKLAPADLWLESQQIMIPSKVPCSLHAGDCFIARIRLTPMWCDSAGTFPKVPAANESSFRQFFYSGAPVSQEQQFTQYADYGKLTQVTDSNKSSLARSRSQPFRSSCNLLWLLDLARLDLLLSITCVSLHTAHSGRSLKTAQANHWVPHECICSRQPKLAVKPQGFRHSGLKFWPSVQLCQLTG